jgi:cytochrome c556
MKRAGIIVLTMVLIVAAGACRPKQPEGPASAAPKGIADFKSVPELKEVMGAMVEEFAESIWSVADEEKVPKDDEGWADLEHATIGLIETFKYLQISNLAKDKGDWQQHSSKLIEAAQAVRSSVQKKDVNAVLDTGYKLYDVCTACHKEYYPTPENARATFPKAAHSPVKS